MKPFIPHMLLNKAEGDGAPAGGAPANDATKNIENQFKALSENLTKELSKLSQKVDQVSKPKEAPKKKEEEADDLEDMILTNPKKAVERIRSQVEESLVSKLSEKDAFASKIAELSADYPEVGDPKSALHVRAKEILESTRTNQWDSAALERAVLRAASEKGVLPMQHRKSSKEDEEEDSGEYLGGGSSSGSRSRDSRRSRSDKLPVNTLTFAELVGVNVKDPKVVERMTKSHNERRGNWGRYK